MELGDIYTEMLEESWGGMSMRQPNTSKGVHPPQEVKNQYTAQQVKFGTTEMLPMTINTFEQEEGSELKQFLDELASQLDRSSTYDRSGFEIIGKIKKKFKL